VATVGWLEQQGYDTTYIASEDMHANGAQLLAHDVFMAGSHDEYWSQEMFNAAINARNAGTSLVFLGANSTYWRIRFEPSPVSGVANRVVVGYKTIESGPVDPSGTSTSTWRDPAGPNRPENELIGQMYIGENIFGFFPLQVSAAEGRNRLWRYTSLQDLPNGSSTTVGTNLVGWEWDSRVANGREPAGVTTVASSPVNGNLSQGNGASQTIGTATQNSTIYQASSGAYVFSTGTNHWWRGLSRNVDGVGEPNARIQQATVNILGDMDAVPTTLSSGLTADPTGAPAVTTTTPATGASNIPPNATLSVRFDRELDPSTIDNGDVTLTLTGPGSGTVPVTTSWDRSSKTITIQPSTALEAFSNYRAEIGTGVRTWRGTALAAPVAWTFSTGPGTPPVVSTQTPASGATNVATDAAVTARFDRRLNPASLTASTFSLRPAAGGAAVAATLSYDDATRTARLVPSARLAESTAYRADLTTGVQAVDGTPMAAAVSWTFTTGTNLTVTGRTPAAFASGVAPGAVARAVFARATDGSTVTASSFTLENASGQLVPATVSYDGATRTAALTPNAPLALLTTYTVRLAGSIRATDGAPLAPTSWSFTTAASAPPAPVTTSLSPTAGATGVSNGATVRATFDQSLDPATVTGQTFTLTPSGGSPLTATVSYDDATRRATLTPSASLETSTTYTARLTTGIRANNGAPLASTITWTFTTMDCPCTLYTSQVPAETALPVRDYRPGTGPWTYELGTKITVTQPSELIALRYYKSAGETGTHVGRLWNASGQQLAQVTYANESASGWQRQALATPVTLQPGQTYVVSVGLNAFYAKTVDGLQAQLSSGPLRSVADGQNGVFNDVAGSFPSSSWRSSSYFVDGVVKLPGRPPRVPAVTSTTPTNGATGVGPSAAVQATFNLPLDSSTVNGSTFTLRDDTNALVPAQVSYNEENQTAVLTPSSTLDTGRAYTARLSTGVRSDDETPLAAAVSWTFTTVPPSAPTVTQTSPSAGAASVTPLSKVTATFSQSMDPATITSTTFTLANGTTAVPAAVAYDAATRTATLTPSAQLSPGVTYTARVGTGARSSRNVALTDPVTWTFTTSTCPCQLYSGTPTPAYTGLSTTNGRGGAGPFTLELGMKIQVTQPARLEAIRFLKDPAETGTHVGRVWSSNGTVLASVTFTGESASGWQQQALSTPLELVPGQTYVVSYGANATFGMTGAALASPLISGPLRSVADGANGVYADAAGVLPTNHWNNSSYFVDAVVR
jgi:hypothetical protein